MDYESLVNEILSRVMAQIKKSETAALKIQNICSTTEAFQTIPETELVSTQGKEKRFDKRVVTEKDLYGCKNEGYNSISISPKTIMTDLSKEYAEKHGITINKA